MSTVKFQLTEAFDPADSPALRDENETRFFTKTRFSFIEDHVGIRPALLHVLLGTSGSGKSSLLRSIIQDLAQKHRILIYATEETKKQYQALNSYLKNTEFIGNLRYVHEDRVCERIGTIRTPEALLKQLQWAFDESKPEIFILDNLTTSVFYDQNPEASQLVYALRNFMTKSRVPFIVVCHTGAHVKEGQYFGGADVRGFRTITNRAEYLYCLFRFKKVEDGFERLADIVHVEKARMHDNAKSFYRVDFNVNTKSYVGSFKTNYAKVAEFLRSKK